MRNLYGWLKPGDEKPRTGGADQRIVAQLQDKEFMLQLTLVRSDAGTAWELERKLSTVAEKYQPAIVIACGWLDHVEGTAFMPDYSMHDKSEGSQR